MPNIKAQHVSVKNITTALLAIGAAGSLVMGSVRFIQGSLNNTYVRRDTLTVYQQGVARRDTLAFVEHVYELRELHAELARIDTSVKCLRIKNQRLPMCDR